MPEAARRRALSLQKSACEVAAVYQAAAVCEVAAAGASSWVEAAEAACGQAEAAPAVLRTHRSCLA